MMISTSGSHIQKETKKGMILSACKKNSKAIYNRGTFYSYSFDNKQSWRFFCPEIKEFLSNDDKKYGPATRTRHAKTKRKETDELQKSNKKHNTTNAKFNKISIN